MSSSVGENEECGNINFKQFYYIIFIFVINVKSSCHYLLFLYLRMTSSFLVPIPAHDKSDIEMFFMLSTEVVDVEMCHYTTTI